jgi:hypothetical protein
MISSLEPELVRSLHDFRLPLTSVEARHPQLPLTFNSRVSAGSTSGARGPYPSYPAAYPSLSIHPVARARRDGTGYTRWARVRVPALHQSY